jgi:beta-galactosidase
VVSARPLGRGPRGESDKEPRRSLFNGLAQLLVRGTKTPGEINIEAYTEEYPGPKLPAARLTVPFSCTLGP